jgi:hypothetical protein
VISEYRRGAYHEEVIASGSIKCDTNSEFAADGAQSPDLRLEWRRARVVANRGAATGVFEQRHGVDGHPMHVAVPPTSD